MGDFSRGLTKEGKSYLKIIGADTNTLLSGDIEIFLKKKGIEAVTSI